MTDAESAKTLFTQGLNFLDANDFADAEARFRATLTLLPRSAPTLTNLAIALFRQGKVGEAREFAEQAVAVDGGKLDALLALANCLAAEKKFAEALAACDRILALDPSIADVQCNRGLALSALGRFGEAVASYDRAILRMPNFSAAHVGRANALAELKRFDEALAGFDRVLAINPGLSHAWFGRGNVLADLKRPNEALDAFDRALKSKPDFAEAWLVTGNIQAERQHYREALAAYDGALKAKPGFAEVWLGRGNVFFNLKRFDDAIAAYDQALQLKPDFANAWLGRGNALLNCRRFQEASAAYDKALAAEPGLNYAEGLRLFSKLQICDWSDYADARARVLAGLKAGARVAQPFETVAVPCSAAEQLTCARQFAAERFPAQPPLAQGRRYTHDRIRVGYLSADLHDHATAYLMAGLFERHDRAQFEVTAISFGPDSRSDMRARLQRAFERFIDVREKSDYEVARLLREHEIDIVVDLMGYVAESRPGIMSHRGAPVQANFLGFPGTMGADFIDYIIGDRVVIPEHDRASFSESVVYLPDCYQANDDKRVIAGRVPRRADVGLPENGFVFCSFNNSYKIVPEMFDIWMQLLGAIDGSVLWLFEGHPAAPENLRREAEKRGIAAERLVFAPRVAHADHLARHRLADLFLDTLPCSAHTTASDALWAGLPVLTCIGTNFSGRVAASLLNSARMPELVTRSLADYEALALKLARDRALLSSLKAMLASNRETCPLFDTERFTRHLESAYRTMWERNQRGDLPASFTVEAIGGRT